MAFLSGSIGFERFQVLGEGPTSFGSEHLEILEQHSSGAFKPSASEKAQIGFLGGNHLFDQTFDLEKNVIDDALHFGVRIDSSQVPAAIRKAWLQIELAGIMAENPDRRPTKAQRQEAKEAVEARCAEESGAGKYQRMSQVPILWDARANWMYFGGSNGSASGLFADLMQRAFEIELAPLSIGKLAQNWAEETKQVAALDDLSPAVFHPIHSGGQPVWANSHSQAPDFLGNEFLLWLWHTLDNDSDTITLEDKSEVTVMFSNSLVLECPIGESGKQTIAAEIPTRLPEALEALRTGKLPRKAGLVLVRFGQQYDLTLQAESFSVSGARIKADKEAEGREVLMSRIDAIRTLNETLDLLFATFCTLRISDEWGSQLERIQRWAQPGKSSKKRSAA